MARADWARERPFCMVCGRGADTVALHTHEIAGGAARGKSLKEPATWLRLCWMCHADVHGWKIAWQLALKWLCDREYYDRVRVNELRGRAPDAVEQVEVEQAVANVVVEMAGLGRARPSIHLLLERRNGQ